MAEQIIILPSDQVSGKKLRTQERVVGANTVQEQYVIIDSQRVVSGVYLAHFKGAIQAAATNGTSTGFWWLYNPVGSTVKVAFRYVEIETAEGTAFATPTSPRVNLTAFTFTGTPAGAALTPRKVDTSFATATAKLMTTQVTSVVTLTQDIFGTLAACIQSASSGGPASPGMTWWYPREDEQPVLAAGEGIVCYQPDAGTTADTRNLITNFAWSEYTVP